MPTPPIPQPRYLNSDIVLDGITQVINVYYGLSPTPSGFISIDKINQIIASSESQVEVDLETWFLVPFVTDTNPPLDWTHLSPTTYGYLFNFFLARSQYNIYRTFFGITGENKGDDFWISELSSSNEVLKRFYKLDQTLNYLFQSFTDVKPNPRGMFRVLTPSRTAILGGVPNTQGNKSIRNSTNPFLTYVNGCRGVTGI